MCLPKADAPSSYSTIVNFPTVQTDFAQCLHVGTRGGHFHARVSPRFLIPAAWFTSHLDLDRTKASRSATTPSHPVSAMSRRRRQAQSNTGSTTPGQAQESDIPALLAQFEAQQQNQELPVPQSLVQNPVPLATQAQRARPARNITGPQSALTDFLASHNISALQIRQSADARRQAAARSRDLDENDDDPNTVVAESATAYETRSSRNETKVEQEKRKRNEQKAIEKIKATKAFKKRKRDADSSDDDDDIARAIFEETRAPIPGQVENCDICGKRFTVTPYSRAGPNGGLLCTPCGKELDNKEGSAKKKTKKSNAGRGKRRTAQSRILDGTYHMGAKALSTLCVETLAKNVDLADSLGDLPEHLIDKIARLFSKRRMLSPATMPLFVQPSTERVLIYDGAKLTSDDLVSIFQVAQRLKQLKIRNAIQFKDEVMEYLLSRNIRLEDLYLHGANLLSEEGWDKFLKEKGRHLNSLKVYFIDKHFGDDTILSLKKYCPSLTRLKISNNQAVTDVGIKHVANLKQLQHLTLNQLLNKAECRSYRHTILKIGKNLETLSLRDVPKTNDDLLEAIHTSCRNLVKLRITDSEHMSDSGFVNLFTEWENPPLEFIDFAKCRHLESTMPRANPELVGLCSDGFRALMKHSGIKIKHLNVHACRHISAEAFEDVFSPKHCYPELRELEISFCEEVTDFIVGSIFATCPNIKEVNVFGCMKVRDVQVPRGKILVGVPNALGMVTEGQD